MAIENSGNQSRRLSAQQQLFSQLSQLSQQEALRLSQLSQQEALRFSQLISAFPELSSEDQFLLSKSQSKSQSLSRIRPPAPIPTEYVSDIAKDDTNGDGYVSRDEYVTGRASERLASEQKIVDDMFTSIDKNQDGEITKQEIGSYYAQLSSRAVRNSRAGQQQEPLPPLRELLGKFRRWTGGLKNSLTRDDAIAGIRKDNVAQEQITKQIDDWTFMSKAYEFSSKPHVAPDEH